MFMSNKEKLPKSLADQMVEVDLAQLSKGAEMFKGDKGAQNIYNDLQRQLGIQLLAEMSEDQSYRRLQKELLRSKQAVGAPGAVSEEQSQKLLEGFRDPNFLANLSSMKSEDQQRLLMAMQMIANPGMANQGQIMPLVLWMMQQQQQKEQPKQDQMTTKDLLEGMKLAFENRATAYAELEAYVEGTITSIQRYLKREIERQWYDPITRLLLIEEGQPTDPPPVYIKHKWNPVRVTDVYQIADAAAKLWGSGTGPIAGDRAKVWQLMGWDPTELEETP